MGVLYSIPAAAALVYGALGALFYIRQRKLLYSPTHTDSKGLGNKLFKPWRTATGEFLGYYRPVANPRRVVVFFHGSNGEALDRAWADELVPSKDLLILAEYPGYGARRGSLSEAGILADAQSVIAQVRASWGRNTPVLAMGEGLGSAVSSFLASQKLVERLALISPFSTEEVASKRYRLYPVKWLLKDKYRTDEYLQKADAPLHVVHGTLDEYAPLEHGRKLFHAYSGTAKKLDEVPGFGHKNLDQAILHSPFTSGFRDFIAE
jgi:pimeloyl-ACP methyl ester carboxylesterase